MLRGDPAGTFAAFWLRGGRVLAGMHVNDWDAIDPIRALVGRSADPARLADPDIGLAELAAAQLTNGADRAGRRRLSHGAWGAPFRSSGP